MKHGPLGVRLGGLSVSSAENSIDEETGKGRETVDDWLSLSLAARNSLRIHSHFVAGSSVPASLWSPIAALSGSLLTSLTPGLRAVTRLDWFVNGWLIGAKIRPSFAYAAKSREMLLFSERGPQLFGALGLTTRTAACRGASHADLYGLLPAFLAQAQG